MSSTKGVGALGIETACPTALLLGPHCEGSSLTRLDPTATSDKSYRVCARWLHTGCRLILAEYKPGPVARVLQLLRGCAWLSGRWPPSTRSRLHTPASFGLSDMLFLSLNASHNVGSGPSSGSLAHSIPPVPRSHRTCSSSPEVFTRVCHSTALCALSLPLH